MINAWAILNYWGARAQFPFLPANPDHRRRCGSEQCPLDPKRALDSAGQERSHSDLKNVNKNINAFPWRPYNLDLGHFLMGELFTPVNHLDATAFKLPVKGPC